jgi:SagB-type dehydrogenase family enzyme
MEGENDNASGAFWPATAAMVANSYRAIHPQIRATGFRTHGLRLRALGLSGLPRLAEDFLLNTRYRRQDRESEVSIQSYFFDPGVLMLSLLGQESGAGVERVPLPEGIKLRRELGEVLGRRRSRRSYTGDPIALDYLATIVRSAGAVTARATVDMPSGDQAELSLRVAPSGGGLYPLDVWVAALRVDGLRRGLYRYDPLEDELLAVRAEERVDDLLDAFALPEEVVSLSRAVAVLLLVGKPWRSMRKYGDRGLRFLFVEAGAIAENVHLAAAALGFGSVDCASVCEDEAHAALAIDGLYETLIHTVILGYPS